MEIVEVKERIENKEYIVKNWAKYRIKGIKSADDMTELLNILLVHDETFESLRGGIFPRSEFCGIFGQMNEKSEAYDALMQFHHFYRTIEEYNEYCKEQAEYMGETVEEFTAYDILYHTEDGYVQILEY